MKRLALLALCTAAALFASAAAAPAARAAGPWFSRVLITNDDGIDNPRLAALARAFAEVAEVVVVAPLGNCSGSTNYVSAFQRGEVAVEPRDLGPGIEAWGVDGFPGDCVLLAVTGLLAGRLPDLVLSGVNSGPNLADAYLASGTIGAARLAAQWNIPAVALSNLDAADADMMEAVPRWCVLLARSDTVRELGPRCYLSVNFPDGPSERVRGACWASLGNQVFHDRFEPAGHDDSGRAVWRQRWWFDDGPDQPALGDVARQRDGWITVSPLHLNELDAGKLTEAAGPPPAALPAWTVH